ncbi:hypothetical protein [Cellulomonas sp. HZM]|uniref:hypothetical protein n=1 Tax=Cellulomonas sp. HZM TaxID=1454010 RepID=UPI0004933D8D|nr:hypothetical protein [Cellulomonas sp. HZM]
MGAKLTAGILTGTLVVLAGSAVAAAQTLGEQSVGRGESAAARFAQARSAQVARWLDPPDDESYSGTQLVAALLYARAAGDGAVVLELPEGVSGSLTATPVRWSGRTTSAGGARITVAIASDVAVHRSTGLFHTGTPTADDPVAASGRATRCYSYAVVGADVESMRPVPCPAHGEAMKAPTAAALGAK